MPVSSTHRRSARAGFTLVEILIVVVILGILAAVIVPQFTNAQSTTRATAMRSQLSTLRNQVAAWQIQNGGAVPGGPGGTPTSMFQTLADDGYIKPTVEAASGFVWSWIPATADLSLTFDPSIEPSIPDADFDGDGDADDVAAIANW